MNQERPHQALARRYRPRSFSEMVGQEAVVRTLRNALASGRIHPAYIFSGIRGVGKTTAARIFAKGLNCANGPTPDPCGACPACEEIARGACLDVLEIDGASHTHAEEARELMQAARYMPARDRYRIFIIDEVHMLSVQAFNALLKTLEEPPPHVVFILATTEPHKIPETIHSRAQHFVFRRVPPPRVARYLQEICREAGVEAEPEALEIVARGGEGSVRDSLTLLDRLLAYADGPLTERETSEALGVVGQEDLLGLLESLMGGDARAAASFVDRMRERGQNLDRFLGDMDETLRTAMRWKLGSDAPTAPQRLKALSSGASLEDLLRLTDLIASTRQRLKGAADPEALVELQLVKAAHLPNILPLDAILGALAGQAPPSRPPSGNGERAKVPQKEMEEAEEAEEVEGLRFRALIPFKRMDEGEAASLESDGRFSAFKEAAGLKVPLAASAIQAADVSLDPDGVLHVALPDGALTAAALLGSPESREVLERSARELGFPGRVVVEVREPDLQAAPKEPEGPKGTPLAEKVIRRLGGQVVGVRPVTPPVPVGGEDAEPE
ncbi:MAG: DNA polymerase III subunit gamma/tau [Acidobacteriota bacterium]